MYGSVTCIKLGLCAFVPMGVHYVYVPYVYPVHYVSDWSLVYNLVSLKATRVCANKQNVNGKITGVNN